MINDLHIVELIKHLEMICNVRLQRRTWDDPSGLSRVSFTSIWPENCLPEDGGINRKILIDELNNADDVAVFDKKNDTLGFAIINAINACNHEYIEFARVEFLCKAWYYIGKSDVK